MMLVYLADDPLLFGLKIVDFQKLWKFLMAIETVQIGYTLLKMLHVATTFEVCKPCHP